MPMDSNKCAQLITRICHPFIPCRLSSKWMQDLCHSYRTPSLEELSSLHCHGPIGGAYSLMKLHENGDKCGSYIVRECDREYNIYYIDINTKM